MTVDKFIEWSQTQPGRHELHAGRIFTMQSERAGHNLAKLSVAIALRSAVRADGAPCTVFSDGMTVQIDEGTAFEPDAVVHCGPVNLGSVFATNPVVVVEIISPSSGRTDTIYKLDRYFRVPSIQHYLIVDATARLVIHARREGDDIIPRVVRAGRLGLDPPGISVEVGDFFADLPLETDAS
jgi:Uma2 family endonuclease